MKKNRLRSCLMRTFHKAKFCRRSTTPILNSNIKSRLKNSWSPAICMISFCTPFLKQKWSDVWWWSPITNFSPLKIHSTCIWYNKKSIFWGQSRKDLEFTAPLKYLVRQRRIIRWWLLLGLTLRELSINWTNLRNNTGWQIK